MKIKIFCYGAYGARIDVLTGKIEKDINDFCSNHKVTNIKSETTTNNYGATSYIVYNVLYEDDK